MCAYRQKVLSDSVAVANQGLLTCSCQGSHIRRILKRLCMSRLLESCQSLNVTRCQFYVTVKTDLLALVIAGGCARHAPNAT